MFCLFDCLLQVSLTTITSDLQELVTGLRVLEGELKYVKGNKQLEDFFAKATARVTGLQADFKSMSDLFHLTVVYFGEDPKTLETTEFFSYFLRFTRNYQSCLKELELQAKQAEKPKVIFFSFAVPLSCFSQLFSFFFLLLFLTAPSGEEGAWKLCWR